METKQINIFPTLSALGEAEINKTADKHQELIKTSEGLKQYMIWEALKFDKNEVKRCSNRIERYRLKRLAEFRAELFNISQAPDWSDEHELVVSIEWRPSRMWRANPKAFTNYGFESRSIGGCGYDKQSTAVAKALNSHLPLIKLLCVLKEEVLKQHKGEKLKREYYSKEGAEKVYKTEVKSEHDLTREYVGYGSGYGVIPRFEGGVGVSCHQSICERLGLRMEHISNMSSSDVFVIKKAKVKA
jgi:hypothetical protein